MAEFELERTYLAKYLPENISQASHKQITDLYIPSDREQAKLRVRKSEDNYEITKKVLVNKNDASVQIEYTIPLDREEYQVFSHIPARRIEKIRYDYQYISYNAQIDVFQLNLLGLVLVDFEFKTQEKLLQFIMPDFCLVDVTQEQFIAGGKLCGKNYEDIEDELLKFSYHKLLL